MRKEDKLRKEIKSILEKINQLEERVFDVHGSNEFGLDLVVLKFDFFHQLRAYGIQIKTGNIKCTGKSSQRIKEIIGQLAIAFGKPVPVDNDKEYLLDGFYLITDGEFQGNAKEYIKSAFVGIRNIHFIDGQSLNEFRVKYGAKIKQFKET